MFGQYWDKTKAVDVNMDKPRLLYFNIGLAMELEKAMNGIALLSILQNESLSTSFNFLVNAYHIGMKTDDRGLTLQRTQEIFSQMYEEIEDEEEMKNFQMGLFMKLFEAFQKCGIILNKKKKEDSREEEAEEEESESVGKRKAKVKK